MHYHTKLWKCFCNCDKIRKAAYVKDDKFLLILDSLGGQTNTGLYGKISQKQLAHLFTENITKCIPLCQLCKIWSFMLRRGHRSSIFEKRVQRRIMALRGVDRKLKKDAQ
jgi:hypothetical protein